MRPRKSGSKQWMTGGKVAPSHTFGHEQGSHPCRRLKEDRGDGVLVNLIK